MVAQNDILISGSDVVASNINLAATDGDVIITAAQDTSSVATENISQDFNDMSTEFNRGRASLDSNSNIFEQTTTVTNTTQRQSNLNARNNIDITSNQDLNILSSNLSANKEISL